MRLPRTMVAAALLVCAIVPTIGSAPEHAAAAVNSVPRPDHVVIVVEENRSNEQVIGNPNAGYLNSLAATGANMTSFFAETHPSQPNYLAMFSGSTQGVTDNSCPHSFDAANLGSSAIAAGAGFIGYSEDLPSVGFTGCQSGKYARKHNPWVNFTNLPASTNRPFADFPTDYSQLPAVSFVVPNLDHDMHDGSIAQGDAWLQTNLGGYAQWARTHNSLLVVTFDEDDLSQNNQIATVIVGEQVQPGAYSEPANHYNLLRTIEDGLGLPAVGASATAAPLLDIWRAPGGNQLPVAVFSSSCAGLSCAFDASGSSDPDGSVGSYAWSFGDGGSGGGVSPSHVYASGGAVSVTLTVTDDRGGSASVTHVVSPVAPAGTPFVADSFNRSVTRGLGVADVGGAWSTVGNQAQFSVAPGGGVLALANPAASLEGFVGPARSDADVVEVLSASKLPVGGPLYLSVAGRRVSANNYYSVKVLINPNGSVTPLLTGTAGGVGKTLAGAVTVPGLTYTAGMSLSVRVQVFGTNPTTVRARVWRTAQAEPSTWQLTSTDAQAALQASGAVGTTAYLSSAATNAPIAVTVTSLTAKPSVAPANQLPVAAFTSSCTQLSCSFDASGSTDPDGTVASYAWMFGDGSTGTGPRPTHAFVIPGDYPVTLTVTDNAGAATAVTHVAPATSPPVNQAPVARFTWTCTRLDCSFDGTASSDPEEGSVSTYAWDFGDRSNSAQSTVAKTFAAAGTYEVTLTVTDDDGATDVVTHEVTVVGEAPNQLPVAVFSSSCAGLSCAFDASGSSDPDGSVGSYAWSFGDGGSGSGVSPSHVYASGGAVSVTLTVTDDRGGSASVTHSVSPVAPNQLPVAVFSSSCAGLSCAFDASGSSDPDGSVGSYAWSFGDGGSGGGVSPSHVYASGGAVSVTLTVTDDRGGSASVTHVVSPVAPAGTPFVADSFNRSVTRGLGVADVGGAWSTVGNQAQFSVAPGGGVLALANPAASLEGFVGPARSDADVVEVLSASKLPVGGPLYLSVAGRRVSANNYYSVKVLINPNGSVTPLLTGTAGGVGKTLAGAVTVPGLTYTAGMSLSVRVQVFGTNPTTVRARVWRTAQAEPSTWQLTSTDAQAALQASGAVGTTAYLSSAATNAPIAVTVTSLTAKPTSAG